jgi:hypothetical protein
MHAFEAFGMTGSTLDTIARRRFLAGAAALFAGFRVPAKKSLPPAASEKRIAAIVTAYHRYSHADNIVTRFIEGFSIAGTSYPPPARVASLWIDQTPDDDIGRPLARHWGVPLAKSIADALTLGGDRLAVDGVLIVAEQGDYPENEKGQRLYPRRQFFEEVVEVFRASQRVVPVFVDKHLSFTWNNAKWMYDQSRELGFPLMAGSSVPVAQRRPELEPRVGTEWQRALSVGYGHFEAYGFHTLEALQVMTERRRGGETGVAAVQCLQGKAAWDAARDGRWDRELLAAALGRTPRRGRGPVEADDAEAHVYRVEYRDGLRAAAYLSPAHVHEFAFAGKVKGQSQPLSCWYELPRPQRDHFSYLVQHVARMMTTGKASYPVERTLLTTGMLAALMESKAEQGRRIETPHLDVTYRIEAGGASE